MKNNEEKNILTVGNASEYVVGMKHAAMRSYSRKLTKGGGITIPSQMRKRLGMEHKDIFEVREIPEEGIIVLKRIKGTCPITGQTTNLVNINGMFISIDVINALKDMGKDLYDYVNTEDELNFIDTALKISEKDEKREIRLKEKEEELKAKEERLKIAKEALDKKKKARKTTRSPKEIKNDKTGKEVKKKSSTNLEDRKKILELDDEGLTLNEISDETGVYPYVIKRVLKQNNNK